jgi:hypothetical protein
MIRFVAPIKWEEEFTELVPPVKVPRPDSTDGILAEKLKKFPVFYGI